MKKTEIQTKAEIHTISEQDPLSIENAWLSVLPEEYKTISLRTCKDLSEQLIAFGEEWALNYPPKSLFITGDYGCGKTTFSFAIIRRYIQNLYSKGIRVPTYFWARYTTGRQLDSALLKACKHEGGDEWEVEKYSIVPLLFIDDIDKVTATERFKVQLFEIINRRSINNMITIITSNSDAKELVNLFDGSVVSRMGDQKKWAKLTFKGKDLRCSHTLTF